MVAVTSIEQTATEVTGVDVGGTSLLASSLELPTWTSEVGQKTKVPTH